MAENQKDRYIQYLVERDRENELTKRAMELVLEDFTACQKALEEKLESVMSEQSAVKAELLEKDKKLKSAESKVRSLQERLEEARQELYGKRRQCVRKKKSSGEAEKPEPDRNDEKGDYDGTEGSLRIDSVDAACPQAAPKVSGQERDLSNRPDTYKRTGVTSTYHSVISTVKLHGGSAWEFIGIFFKNIFNSCRDYANMIPGKLAIATCQG